MTSWFSSEGRSEFFPKRVPEDSKQVAAPTKTKVSQDRGGGIPTEHGCFMMCGPCCILYYLDIIIICETETETLHSSFRENLANYLVWMQKCAIQIQIHHHSSPPPHQHQHQHQRFLRLSARIIDTIHHRQVSYHFWIVALHCHYYHFSISVGVGSGSGTGELHRIKRVVASLLLSGMLLVDMNMNMNHES